MGILLVYDVTDEKSFNSKSYGCRICQMQLLGGLAAIRAAVKEMRLTESWLTRADIRTWFSNVEQHASEGVNKILIGNKCDWEEKRQVSTEQGQQLADELGIPFMEVSAKTNINIEKAFYSLAGDIKKRLMDSSKDVAGQQSTGVAVGGDAQKGAASGCC